MEKTNLGLAKWSLARVGWPYWYGTTCNLCTEALLKRKAAQFPEHYGESRMPRYRSDIAKGLYAADCSGLIKGYWWDNNGTRIYEQDGRPDTNANGIFRRATVKGSIRTLPEVPGALLWHDGHIGVYVGGGELVEARGFHYGVVKSKVSQRNFTNWCFDPFITYLDGEVGGPSDGALGDRTLRKGDTGADVVALQKLLIGLGYSLPKYGADGEFGSETQSAVVRFQADADLQPDGIVGAATLQALLAAAEGDMPDEGTPGAGGDEDGPGGPAVTVTGGSVYIRTGPGTEFAKLGTAHQGDRLVKIDTGGWVPILINGSVGWISGKYVK